MLCHHGYLSELATHDELEYLEGYNTAELTELREYCVNVLSQDAKLRPPGRNRTDSTRLTPKRRERLASHMRDRREVKGATSEEWLKSLPPHKDPRNLLVSEEPRLKQFHCKKLVELSNADEDRMYGELTCLQVVSILKGSQLTTEFLFRMIRESVLGKCTGPVHLFEENAYPETRSVSYPLDAIVAISKGHEWGAIIGKWHAPNQVGIQRIKIHHDPLERQVEEFKAWFRRLDSSVEFTFSDIEFPGRQELSDTSMLLFCIVRAIFLKTPLCVCTTDLAYERYRRIFELGLLDD
jgi:hypothetical protein